MLNLHTYVAFAKQVLATDEIQQFGIESPQRYLAMIFKQHNMTTEQAKELKALQRELKTDVKNVERQQKAIDRKLSKLEKLVTKYSTKK